MHAAGFVSYQAAHTSFTATGDLSLESLLYLFQCLVQAVCSASGAAGRCVNKSVDAVDPDHGSNFVLSPSQNRLSLCLIDLGIRRCKTIVATVSTVSVPISNRTISYHIFPQEPPRLFLTCH